MNKFIQGYACAVATLLRLHGCVTTDVEELFHSCLSINILKASGIDDNDMQLFEEYRSELEK